MSRGDLAYCHHMLKRAVTGALGAIAVLLAGCNGSVSGGELAAGGNDDSDTDGYDTDGVGVQTPAPSAQEPRVVRLTHVQYASTLQDLFGIDDELGGALAPDALNGFNFDTSSDLRVDSRLGPQYRNVAEQLAERAVEDDDVFERIVPCSPSALTCAAEFIESFGEQAFRRPLTNDEVARFEALFAQGEDLVGSGDEFKDGVRLIVEAMLQSPQFLYRAELSNRAAAGGRVALDPYELASRLSYFIYDSMPDADLFSRAREGRLETPEQIEAAARRMLGEPRARQKLIAFHEQAWQFGRFGRIAPDAQVYSDVPSDFIARVRSSAERFIDAVIDEGGGLTELLTAPYAFADSALATFYGESAQGGRMSRIDLTESGRKGFLMQIGFLASNSYAVKTDPIHRGLFVIRDLLCRNIPDPPAGATLTPLPDTGEPIETTREEISVLTGQSYCPTCHSQINPPGFAFEGFDAVGKARTHENGVPVDTSGVLALDGREVSFSGPGELVEALAASEEAQSCYASRWLEYAYGRPLSVDDEATRDALMVPDQGIEDLVIRLVTSPQFSSRKP